MFTSLKRDWWVFGGVARLTPAASNLYAKLGFIFTPRMWLKPQSWCCYCVFSSFFPLSLFLLVFIICMRLNWNEMWNLTVAGPGSGGSSSSDWLISSQLQMKVDFSKLTFFPFVYPWLLSSLFKNTPWNTFCLQQVLLFQQFWFKMPSGADLEAHLSFKMTQKGPCMGREILRNWFFKEQ